MKIGPYKLISIITSKFKLDGGAMFGVVPKPLWNRYYPADDKNRIDMVTRSLLLISDEHKILIDSGNGSDWDEKFKMIYKIQDEKELDKTLNGYNLSAEDITHVIHTHLHFDHAGGSAKINEGEKIPSFPNAKYIVHKKHFDWAMNPSPRDKASFRKSDFECIENSGQFEFVESEGNILPNIDVLITQGHTPFQILPKISDNEKTLLFCGDTIPLSAQLAVPWVMAYDLFPLKTVEEKTDILNEAVENNWWMMFEHDPYTEMCTVLKETKGFTAGKISTLENAKP